MTAGSQAARWAHVAFLNGELAAIAGVARSGNPHPAGSVEARNWSSGWKSHRKPAPARSGTGNTTAPGNADAGANRQPASQQPEGQTTMDLLEKLPGMTDADLGTLMSNAERLAQGGNPKQQRAAEAALPAIRAETARRNDLKPPPVKRATRSRKVATAAPAATPTAEAG